MRPGRPERPVGIARDRLLVLLAVEWLQPLEDPVAIALSTLRRGFDARVTMRRQTPSSSRLCSPIGHWMNR